VGGGGVMWVGGEVDGVVIVGGVGVCSLGGMCKVAPVIVPGGIIRCHRLRCPFRSLKG
jgi:hypothetical protein